MTDLITPARAELLRRGHVVLADVIARGQIDRLGAELEELFTRWAEEIEVPREEYLEVVSQVTNVWEQSRVFETQLQDPRLAEIAAGLIGCERTRVFHDHLIVKPPRGGATVPWHRDFPNWPLEMPRAVSCWIPLDDVTADSGALRFMPGGHLEPITPSIDFLNEAKDWGDRLSEVEAVPVRRGSVVFHHCLSWHTTPPNQTDNWRRAYVVIYMDADSRFSPERAPWHPMTGRVTAAAGERFNDDVFPRLGRKEVS